MFILLMLLVDTPLQKNYCKKIAGRKDTRTNLLKSAGVVLVQSLQITDFFQYGVRMASETENYFTSVDRIQALLSLPFLLSSELLTPTSDYIIYSDQMSIILVLCSKVFFHVSCEGHANIYCFITSIWCTHLPL